MDGVARLQRSNQINPGSSVVIAGGQLAIGRNSNTVASVQLTAGSIVGSDGTLTSATPFDLQGGRVSATLGGAAGIAKSGTGTVRLTGTNIYTGPTNVTAGSLEAGISNAGGPGNLGTRSVWQRLRRDGYRFRRAGLGGFNVSIGSLSGSAGRHCPEYQERRIHTYHRRKRRQNHILGVSSEMVSAAPWGCGK